MQKFTRLYVTAIHVAFFWLDWLIVLLIYYHSMLCIFFIEKKIIAKKNNETSSCHLIIHVCIYAKFV